MNDVIVVQCPHCEMELGLKFESDNPDHAFEIECPMCGHDFLASSDGSVLPVSAEEAERLINEMYAEAENFESIAGQDGYGKPLQIGYSPTEFDVKGTPLESLLSVGELKDNLMCLDDGTLAEELEYIRINSDFNLSEDVEAYLKKYRQCGRMAKRERLVLEGCYLTAWATGTGEVQ